MNLKARCQGALRDLFIATTVKIKKFRVPLHESFEPMKKDIHPKNYRMVVFQDASAEYEFLTRSTVPTRETIKWKDGNEYPLVKLEISNMSHPFFTGKMKFVDTAGRIEKFNKKYSKKK